jgi:hypothetical protein
MSAWHAAPKARTREAHDAPTTRTPATIIKPSAREDGSLTVIMFYADMKTALLYSSCNLPSYTFLSE